MTVKRHAENIKWSRRIRKPKTLKAEERRVALTHPVFDGEWVLILR
jgi:hypothetical protein